MTWDGHIWSSAAADHVHLSFSKAGGAGLTSFWKGRHQLERPRPRHRDARPLPPPGPPVVLATTSPASGSPTPPDEQPETPTTTLLR